MLEDWEKEEIETNEHVMDYAYDLWKTASHLDKELKISKEGHEIEMNKLKLVSKSRIGWIKSKCIEHISSLENALKYTKERYSREIEGLTMKLSEYESRLMNQEINEPELSEILNTDPNTILNQYLLKSLIYKLQKAGKTLQNEALKARQAVSAMESQQRKLETTVGDLETKVNDMNELK